MKVNCSLIKTIVLALLFVVSTPAFSQCFEIKSILVDACGEPEGFNEMVRFETGSAPFNTSALNVNWPSNPWKGLIQNAQTANIVAQLNANIAAAGGCGQLIQPVGNTIPPNATVILFTSYVLDVSANEFGALSEDIYVIFQNNNTTTSGHFANTGTGNRTLTMSVPGCNRSVTYNRALLVGGGDGDVVNFSNGVPSYDNNGCTAPVAVFDVDAGPDQTTCPGIAVLLDGFAEGHTTLNWSAPSGTFSDASIVNPVYTPDASATGSVTLTLTMTGTCGNTLSDTVEITIDNSTTPDFATALTFCSGETVPTLVTTSPNGITGTWSPAVISNTTSGTYIFTPDAGQCAAPATLNVTITNAITPDFATTLTFCSGETVPTLAATSPNGITGTWSPAVISNTASGTYTFAPDAGQCTAPVTLNVTITNSITPDFATSLTFCSGETVPTLASTSPNGITGTWSPSVISNTTSGTYTFTPDANQCAAPVTLNVTIINSITPDFATALTFCSGETVPTLATTSPNGITGTWSPAVIDNATSGTYIFTPNAGQCAASVTLNVTITNAITPDFATALTFCSGETVPTLATTSPNGITGTWSPAVISNTTSGTYIFTPDAGQCAAPVTLNVTITNAITPDFATALTFCSGETVPTLAATSPNGITGTWSPSVISNTTSGTYTFTPDAGQCAAPVTLNVTITNSITPDFATSLTFCSGETVPTLATTSLNGITGTWSPSVIDNTTSGTYTFTPDANQCAAPVTLNVTITTAITPDFATSLTFCSGETVPTLATTSPNGITGTWSPSVISNTTSGTYIFTPDVGQCAEPLTLDVTISASTPVVITGPALVCAGEAISLSADVGGGVWTTSNPAVATIDAGGTVQGISGGTVTISYSIATGCASAATHTVVVGPRVVPQLENAAICQNGQTVVLNTGLPAAGYSFVWTRDGETISGGGRTITVSAPGQYSVVATHLSSGCSGTASAQVSVSAPLFATATIAEDFNRIQTISVQVAGGSGQFEFQLNDGPRQSSPYFSGYFDGEYTVTVYDLNGCDTVELTVFALNYPRFFTPNDDGYNDSWNIDGVQEGVIFIFDRYGKLLKQLRAGVNGWDGTYNGYALPATDYWFTLEYVNQNGDAKTFKSHFSLLR